MAISSSGMCGLEKARGPTVQSQGALVWRGHQQGLEVPLEWACICVPEASQPWAEPLFPSLWNRHCEFKPYEQPE